MSKWTTLTEFIQNEERQVPDTRGILTLLLTQIGEATKVIASKVKNSGLIGIEGASGKTNTFQEEVQKLDEFSNDLMIDMLIGSGQVATIISEEMEKPHDVKSKTGEYIIYMDPIDGSSNIDVNVSVGTIFSIYQNNKNGLLQKGKNQVAAGYALYGSSVMFVYSCGGNVNGFTLDPSIGTYLLSHPDIRIPEKQSIYSINEGYFNQYNENIQSYLTSIKSGKNPYTLRYIGSMVADIHRTLLKGGIFLYPENKKDPDGKLRLMLEVNPLCFLIRQAGGKSIAKNNKNPLNISPSSYHQRTSVVTGSKEEIKKYQSFISK